MIKSVKNYKNQINKVETAKPSGLKSDKIEISSSAKEFQIALSELKKLPELREAKVNELREQINAGNYKVDSAKIAEAILRRMEE